MLGDERAVATFPLKLLCYIILLAMISGFVVQGIMNVRIPAAAADVEREACKILIAVDSLQQGAPRNLLHSDASEGSKRAVDITLPEHTFLSLGSDPDDLKAGMMIVYQVEGGSKHIEHVDIKICAAARDAKDAYFPGENGLLLKSGRHRLTFELVQNPASGERWIIVY